MAVTRDEAKLYLRIDNDVDVYLHPSVRLFSDDRDHR